MLVSSLAVIALTTKWPNFKVGNISRFSVMMNNMRNHVYQ